MSTFFLEEIEKFLFGIPMKNHILWKVLDVPFGELALKMNSHGSSPNVHTKPFSELYTYM